MGTEQKGTKLGAFLLGASCAACAGVEWQSLEARPGYEAPERLNVQVVAYEADPARDPQLMEAIEELVDSMFTELEEHGIRATLWSSGALPPPPALFVVVQEWEPGSQAARFFCGGFGCSEGRISVYFQLFGHVPPRELAGVARGWVRSGVFGGSSLKSADAAGTAIGCVIVRGRKAGLESCH